MIKQSNSSSSLAGERRSNRRRGTSGNSKRVFVSIKPREDVPKKIEFSCNLPSCHVGFEEPHSEMTLKKLFSMWLEQSKLRVKQSTFAAYYRMIESHLVPYFGNISLSEWNGAMIDHFVRHCLQCGRTDGKGGLSPKSVADIVYVIKSVIRFGKTEGYLQDISERIILPRRIMKEIRVLSMEEQSILEQSLWACMDRRRMGIMICLYTGIRLGEVCGLRWEDVNLSTNTLRIRRTLQRIKNTEQTEPAFPKTLLILDSPKSKSSIREIPIVEGLAKLLKQYSRHCESSSYLLTGKKKYVEPRAYQRTFHRYISQAGLRDVNFHALRHTFATRCIEKGVDAKSLSEILGHANVNITLDRYVHSSFEWKRCQLARLAV